MTKDSWYQLGIKDIFERLSTSEEGLDATEAEKRIGTYGPNRLAEDEKISRITILIHQFKSPLIYILMIAAVITGFLKEFIDMGVILAVIVLNALIGYFQEFKAEESVRALKKMLVPKARVVRNGNEKEIHSEDLVPGDVVLLTSGSLVPADMRLFKTVELNIDESALTGESIPAEKNLHAIKEDNLTPGDQKNMAFLGTIVVSGRGKGVIVETGSRTELGTIAENVTGVSRARAPIQDKLERFAKIIGAIVVTCSTVIFFAGIIIGESAADMFMVAVAAAVATIPEGLPIVVTIAMAIGVSRMARRNAIIRKLPAVETLGSTTVIGSDKTGTLTKNEMTVRLIFDGEHTFEVTGSGYDPGGQIIHEQMPLTAKELNTVRQTLRIGMLCNESSLYEADGLQRVDGDPTEGALIVSAMKAGLDPYVEKEQYVQIAMLPFESERGYMATLHKHRGKKIIFVKGSLDKLLDLCTTCMIGEALRKRAFFEASESFARQGLRVLSMAYKEVSPDVEELTHHDVEEGLVFAGIQGMIDPPRPEAIEAIKMSKEAGIRTVMITGDYAVTSVAVAKSLGIGGDEPRVITGKEIEPMGDDELYHAVSEVSVYARVSPQQKLRITEQLIRHGEVVAITGDGVNDAPSLKAGHIGIAMGKTGTDVAKEASDMVITDDNFASIFAAVEEGRIVFENIRKVAFFLIPTGIAAVLSIFGTMMLGLPIPYVPAQLLWINLVTNGLQDVALAFEPGEKDIIRRSPRKRDEGIMSKLLVQRTILVGAVISVGVVLNFSRALQAGDSIEQARTVAVTTMVFFQFFQAWNARSEMQSVFRMSPTENPFLFYSMIAALFAHLSVLYVPAFRWIFRTTPLAVTEWLEILAVSSIIIVIVEFDKWMKRRKVHRNVMASENT